MSLNQAPAAPADTAVERGPQVPGALSRVALFLRLRCPRCASGRVNRSHRRSQLERILAVAVLPYRCELCSFRFFRFRGVGACQ